MNFGFLGTITFADAANIRSDNLTYLATNLDDSIQVNANGMIRLSSSGTSTLGALDVFNPGIGGLELAGAQGNDNFSINGGQPFSLILVAGGAGADNRLNIVLPSGSPVIDLGPSIILGYGSAIRYSDIAAMTIREQQTRRISRYDRRRCDADHGAE